MTYIYSQICYFQYSSFCVDSQDPIWFHLPSARTAGVVLMKDSLNFSMSQKNLYFALILEIHFSGYVTLGSLLFSLSTLTMSLHFFELA